MESIESGRNQHKEMKDFLNNSNGGQTRAVQSQQHPRRTVNKPQSSLIPQTAQTPFQTNGMGQAGGRLTVALGKESPSDAQKNMGLNFNFVPNKV